MPLKNKMGEIIGILGITVDITGVKKAEVAKADFISNMEHDLKTPFSGIGGIANILFDMETDPQKKELLGLMVKSCKQWEEVHHRIFDSLVVEQPSSFHIETLSISRELSDIYEMMSATLHLKKLGFVIEPISAELDKIKTDKVKFRIILSSLISNAINFTECGMVTIRVLQEEDYCILQVIDTGIGIASEQFEIIFEKFSKLSRSNKCGGNFTGVGLGLFVARQYATQLSATLSVESTVGKGSTFILKLPITLKRASIEIP
jgi:signal transduction histidine kinase